MIFDFILYASMLSGAEAQLRPENCEVVIHGPAGTITCAMVQPSSLDCPTPTVERDRYESCVLYVDASIVSTIRSEEIIGGIIECVAEINKTSRGANGRVLAPESDTAYSNSLLTLQNGQDQATLSFHWVFRWPLEPPVVRVELQSVNCTGVLTG